MRTGSTTVVLKHTVNQGVFAGLLGCIFGILGIFTFGLVFVPLAAICSLLGLIRGVAGFSISGIGCSLLASILTVWGFAFSPTLWVLVGAGILAQHKPPIVTETPPPAASAPTSEAARGAVPNSLVFHANKQGHVVLDGVVNGAPVRFLVDTGATMLVLTLRDAAAAGFGPGGLVFSLRTSTANGVARAAPVRLREVRIGQFSADEVPAAVAENLDISLLGQSFLTRLDSYEMRDGVLTLNYW